MGHGRGRGRRRASAPSPTGALHLGGLRTALFNYLLARHGGGRFFVRIEDTDAARNVAGAEEDICEGLRWAGLLGEHDLPPVRQSTRLETYRAAAER